MDPNTALLLVDTDVHIATFCKQVAVQLDCGLVIANDQSEAEAALARYDFGIALIDADTIPQYLDLTRHAKERSARMEVLIAQTAPTIPKVVETMQAGASDYIEKPLDARVLEQAISRALQRYRAFQPSVLPLEQVIRRAITRAVSEAEGDKIKAARLLAIGKTTLYRKLNQYGEYTGRKARRSYKNGKSDVR